MVGSAWSTEGIRGTLAFGKLTLDDVTIVDVSTAGAGIKALPRGREILPLVLILLLEYMKRRQDPMEFTL